MADRGHRENARPKGAAIARPIGNPRLLLGFEPISTVTTRPKSATAAPHEHLPSNTIQALLPLEALETVSNVLRNAVLGRYGTDLCSHCPLLGRPICERQCNLITAGLAPVEQGLRTSTSLDSVRTVRLRLTKAAVAV